MQHLFEQFAELYKLYAICIQLVQTSVAPAIIAETCAAGSRATSHDKWQLHEHGVTIATAIHPLDPTVESAQAEFRL